MGDGLVVVGCVEGCPVGDIGACDVGAESCRTEAGSTY